VGRRRGLVLGLCLLALPAPLAAQGDAVARSHLSYDIEVTLDPEQHTLTGRQRIHFENVSRAPLPQLVFHLYLNAFRDRRSVFAREGGVRLRGRAPGRPGSIMVTRLTTAAGQDLAQPLALEPELVRGDFTQLRVRLPEPLPPSAAIDLVLEWRAELPQLVARAGYAGEFHMLGQWFPKLAKLAPDGSFVSFPYHGFGEFYADFADYQLTLEVPERFAIASSGVRLEERVQNGRRVERYAARRVHDVAWAAYPYFEARTEQVGATTVRLYAPRGYGAALARQARVLTAALPYFEARYGAYPYPALTVIIPPREGYAASGMEYPTLFTSEGPWWALPSWLPDPRHEVVSIHELAHQWFSGLIANNEVAHPVLDEGLTQWACLDFLRDYYGRPQFLSARLPFGPFDVLRAAFAARSSTVPSSLLPADRYNARTLASAVYARPAVVLEQLADRRGRPQLTAALSRYARAQRFRHPAPSDLWNAFETSLGPGWGRVLRRALEGESPGALQVQTERDNHAPSGFSFLPELWTLASALLRGVGP